MKEKDPLLTLLHLVGGTGFPSRDSLGSFCIAVGIFHGLRADLKGPPPKNWDPSRYDIWPMLELIAYQMDPGIDDRNRMRMFLFPYLVGGAEMVARKVDGSAGIEALKQLSIFIPA